MAVAQSALCSSASNWGFAAQEDAVLCGAFLAAFETSSVLGLYTGWQRCCYVSPGCLTPPAAAFWSCFAIFRLVWVGAGFTAAFTAVQARLSVLWRCLSIWSLGCCFCILDLSHTNLSAVRLHASRTTGQVLDTFRLGFEWSNRLWPSPTCFACLHCRGHNIPLPVCASICMQHNVFSVYLL